MKTQVLRKEKSYRELLLEFLDESSIHGLKIFRLTVSVQFAKRIWFAFITLVIIYTHYVIGNLIVDFLQQPTELHMSTNMVHVENSPFPGIGICSANKISRRKLLAYANEVYRAQQRFRPNLLSRSPSELAEHLVLLAGFYLHPYYDFHPDDVRLLHLHDIFTSMYNTTEYPLRDIMKNVAPDCNELVIRLAIFGDRVNVSNYIIKRTTSSSNCCMFNYNRVSYSSNNSRQQRERMMSRKANSLFIESNSVLNSIQFVVQYDDKDVTYKDLSNDAFQINIFSNEDYPLVQSNTVGELLVQRNSIMEIPIQPRIFASSSSIGSFSPSVRKCYFPLEGQKLFNLSYYSIDECLLVCRMQSMIQYCGCISPPMKATEVNVTTCNFLDLVCLTKWKAVWYGWNYFDYVTAGTDEQKSSYQGCNHCLPTCDGVEFDIDSTSLPLRHSIGKTYTHGILANLSNEKPLAVIKVFFQERFVQETIEDVVADWILLLNRFGGILSLMYGFSIISYIEIVYFLSGKWFYHLCRRKPEVSKKISIQKLRKTQIPNKEEKPVMPLHFELYWNELKPKYTHSRTLKYQNIFFSLEGNK